MRFRRLLLLMFCLSAFHLNAQNDDITFRRISPPGGYSFQAIRTFNQDKFGYIWMGSFDGVIRYDSREITRFIHNPEEANGLPSDVITSLVIDKQNNIWAGADKGLCLFNHQLHQFERVFYNYENGETANTNLFSIELDEDGKLWIADENFFGYLDPEKRRLFRITEGLNKPPRLLYNDKMNRLWLGAEDGSVYLVAPDEKKVVKKIEGPGSRTRTICAYNDEIWVGYESHGARLFDMEGNLKIHYRYASNPRFDIESASVRKIWRDTRGQIWIGSYHGLFLSVGDKLIHFPHDEYEGLPHNSIYDIFEDEQGGIWIGAWSGGVSYLHHADNKFNNYRHSKEPASISDNMVSSFAQSREGDVFVGTEQGGLNRFDPETTSFQRIAALETEGVLNVKALCVDDQEGLWVACAFKGVYYRPKNQNNFIHFELGEEDGKHISALGAYALCKSDSGMWIGTNFGGVNFYNFNTRHISFLSKKYPFSQFNDVNIRSLAFDSKDNLWTATSQGIYRIHLPTGNSTNFSIKADSNRKTRTQSFYFVTELSDGKIWMGAGGDGINIYHPETDELHFFDANGLLKGKDVYGVIESDDNLLWITSNDGLILYNTQDKSSRRFVITDGIQGNLFNPNSIFKDRDGNLYFGGTNGFSQLEPKEININSRPPNILINSIKINNREIIPKQTGVNQFASLVLSPKETTLHFNFSADNFLLPEKNRFMFRLTNYVDQWREDNAGAAAFVNIPAGEYVLEIKACNNDGVWNEIPARLPIVINQFWYKSNLALALYSLAFLTIIMLVVRFYRERLKLKKALLIEKIKHEHEEQLHEMKLRFFTNISHEFRTPLTLITWPIKNLLKSTSLTFEQRDQLETVTRNTNRLLQLINQIMDLRKVEEGQAKLNISRIELVDFIKERMLNFSEAAKSKKISFSFSHKKDRYIIEADEEKLDKIIYNLLSNAFKFTPVNGKIIVFLQKGDQTQNGNYFSNQLSFGKLEEEDFVEILVTDNGRGIDSDDLPNIFNRFEQGKREKSRENSTGIGLTLCKDYTLLHRGVIIVQSTPGEGTRFSVRIPSKQKVRKILYEGHQKVKNINSWEITGKADFQAEAPDKDVKILIIEDNEDLRRFILKFLQRFYSVLYADNGKQGLEILKTHNVQLIISDVMTPVMDGFEFCQKIKSQIETSHIPVILLTALSSAANTATGFEKGADAYISKPFDENVLLSQIKNLLLQRKRLQESYKQKFIAQKPMDIGNLDNYFLNKVNGIIEDNIENESFSVVKLAAEVGLSRSQLHRKLKQISNNTASEYIMMVKIRKATSLLASKKYNIDEVAFKAGFNSHSYFTKCFKKIHNQSPSEFLKSLKK